MSEQMFVTVRYGDNQKIILNPCCPTATFIEWIKKKCNFEQNAVLDLVDSAGQLSNLSASPRSYVNDIINMGETYILILVERENGGVRYVSLLDNLDKINPEIFNKLGSLSGCAKSGKRDKPKRSNKAGKVRSGAVSGKTR